MTTALSMCLASFVNFALSESSPNIRAIHVVRK